MTCHVTDNGYSYKRYRLRRDYLGQRGAGEGPLTHFPISDKSRFMGRPSLNVKPTLVRLPEGVPERIDAVVGKNRRAEFIRQAVLKELQRHEAEKTSSNTKGDLAANQKS